MPLVGILRRLLVLQCTESFRKFEYHSVLLLDHFPEVVSFSCEELVVDLQMYHLLMEGFDGLLAPLQQGGLPLLSLLHV